MEKMAKFTTEEGEPVMVLVDMPGLTRLIQAARRSPNRRAGSGPFLVQIEGPNPNKTQKEKPCPNSTART